MVSNESLQFRPYNVNDPVLLGCQILMASGFEPVNEYSVFAILPSGDFEDVRLDETFDIRAKHIEKFVVFRSDRSFSFTLNDREIRWGVKTILGSTLYTLAGASQEEDVFLEVHGGKDRLVESTDIMELASPRIEKFYTAIRTPQTYEIVVNWRPRTVLGNLVTFEQIVQLAFPGSVDCNTVYNMSYQMAASRPPTGELGPGGSVKIKKGTAFNVTSTTKS